MWKVVQERSQHRVSQQLEGFALLGEPREAGLMLYHLGVQLVYPQPDRLKAAEVMSAVNGRVTVPTQQAQRLVPLLQHEETTKVDLVFGLDGPEVPEVLDALRVQPLLPLLQLLLVAVRGRQLGVAEFPLFPDLLINLLLPRLRSPIRRQLLHRGRARLVERLSAALDLLFLLSNPGTKCFYLLRLRPALPLYSGIAVACAAHQAPPKAAQAPGVPPEALAGLAALGHGGLPEGMSQRQPVVAQVGFRGAGIPSLAWRSAHGGRGAVALRPALRRSVAGLLAVL
mmetsp:Transcript_130695/g.364176  ORF Transcript_130695/g.364176 Transcript_130695/m.364176 type:complete len:284 (-) Transcript_130695:415-1266(-)